MTAGKKDKPLLLLFDGNALIHRAFHALPPLSIARTGEMVSAVRGFAATLLKLLKENKPTYWAIAFDRPTPTFRHIKFADWRIFKVADKHITIVYGRCMNPNLDLIIFRHRLR